MSHRSAVRLGSINPSFFQRAPNKFGRIHNVADPDRRSGRKDIQKVDEEEIRPHRLRHRQEQVVSECGKISQEQQREVSLPVEME